MRSREHPRPASAEDARPVRVASAKWGYHRGMASSWVVVVFGVGAALAFALSTTLKNRMSTEVTDLRRQPTRLATFVAETVRHPLWLLAAVADIVGLGLQVTALHFGTLTLVQPLLVTGLLFALLLRHGAFWRIGRPELLWALVLTGCLIGFLIASGAMSTTSTVSGADRLPGGIAALAALLAGGGCLVLAQRSVPPAGRAALIGAAVGGVYAGTAALIKAATDVLIRRGALGSSPAGSCTPCSAWAAWGCCWPRWPFKPGR